jgi:arylsulfatase A-like enzyme
MLGLGCLAQAATRPNFLFIYTDDQRHDALSVVQQEQGEKGRFPWLKTPHLDRLASEGVRFRQAFVVNSLCAPSRAVNLTGRYNHLNGIASNFRPFPTNNVTHATLLRSAGYSTAYIGKWHMDSQRDRPGFDHHASFIGHARYVDPPFIVDGKDTPTQGWIDDLSTDYAIAFMKRQQSSDRPWSMVVGFKSPHGPFDPPARTKTRFTGELARAVPNLTTPVPYLGDQARRRDTDSKTASVPVNLDYFRCISAVDDCVGRLLDALETCGFYTNTVVIYTSDNGYYLGEHGLGDKRSAYEESLRVPLLVRYPALGSAARGRVADEMVLNLDLAQTLLDFAGVPAPKEMQGRSWRPLLTSPGKDWRQAWFYEYFAENQKNSRVPDITAIRTANAKLIRYPDHPEWTELFDLKADPYELNNLYRDPAHQALRTELEAGHQRLLGEVGYRVPAYTDRPAWWGKPGGPDGQPENLPRLRLALDFSQLNRQPLADTSGCGQTITAVRTAPAAGREQRGSLYLSGNAHLEVAKAKSLSPAMSAWTVEITAKAQKPDGVLLAHGGKTQGYMLWLNAGKPAFTVNVSGKTVTVQARDPLPAWGALAGTITTNRQLQLRINGQLVGEAPLPGLIAKDPNDGMQVGADLTSPVLEPTPPKFSGWIESLRIISGEWKP